MQTIKQKEMDWDKLDFKKFDVIDIEGGHDYPDYCDTLKSNKYYYFGKFLYPYFGGKSPAPHNIVIKMSYI